MKNRFTLLALLALVHGCSGGGGEPLPLTLTLAPNPLTAQFTQAQLPGAVAVQATVSGTVSVSTIYIAVADSVDTFDPGSVTISGGNPPQYSASLNTRSGLAVGQYQGTLTISLCGDPACHSLLGRSALSYKVIVQPNPPPTLQSLGPQPLHGTQFVTDATQITAVVGGYVPDSQTLYARVRDSGGVYNVPNSIAMTRAGNVFSAGLQLRSDAPDALLAGSLDVSICGDAACSNVIGSGSLPYSIRTLKIIAGTPGVEGDVDGQGAGASLFNPNFLTMDTAGNTYVSQLNGSVLRKVDLDGNVTTVAHVAGNFSGVALDGAGNVYLSDTYRNQIVRIAPDGTQSIVAGPAQGGCYFEPSGMAFNAGGSGYTVNENYDILAIPAGICPTSPVAGMLNSQGGADGQGANARFGGGPSDIKLGPDGNYYIADDYGATIRKMTPDFVISTIAGSYHNFGNGDGTGSTASFINPAGMAIAPDGTMYVGDFSAASVRVVTPVGVVTTMFRNVMLPTTGRPFSPWGVAITADGKTLLLSDEGNDVVVRTHLP